MISTLSRSSWTNFEVEIFTCKLCINKPIWFWPLTSKLLLISFYSYTNDFFFFTKSNISHAFHFSFVSVDFPRQRKAIPHSRGNSLIHYKILFLIHFEQWWLKKIQSATSTSHTLPDFSILDRYLGLLYSRGTKSKMVTNWVHWQKNKELDIKPIKVIWYITYSLINFNYINYFYVRIYKLKY